MRKYGKYEKRPEAAPVKQPKVKNMLLQTYFTSLLCLVLCVTMFMGTSYAWFTSEVNNTGNEIYIGTLDVGLFAGEKDLSKAENKLFDSNIRWEPGYTALETIRVVNEGDLAFEYVLNFTEGSLAEGSTQSIEDVAEYFDVWVYNHRDNQNNAPTPASYSDIIAKDSGWENAGSLDELLAGKTVLDGVMITVRQDDKADDPTTPNQTDDGVATEDTYTIALHMKEDATADVMGQKISLNVKLIAYQMAKETDGFNSSDYDNVRFVSTDEELQAALDEATGDVIIQLTNDVAGDVTVTQKEGVNIVIDGNGKTVDGTICINGQSRGDATETLTIRNIAFVNSKASTASIDAYLDPSNETRYAHNLTVEGCTFTMTGDAKHTSPAVDLYQPYNFTMKNCEVTCAHSVIQNKGGHNGITVDGVTATDCKNGIGLGTMDGAISISNCEMNVSGYGIRIDASVTGQGVTISDCKITANIPVVVRKATGKYTLTFNGQNTMTQTNADGVWCAVGIEEYGDVAKADLGTAAETIVVTLNDTGLSAAGVYIAGR